MKLSKLLTITTAAFMLAACAPAASGGGSTKHELPAEHEDGVHTFTVTNLTDLQSGWPGKAEGAEAGLSKTFEISVFTSGEEGNAEQELAQKNLELLTSDSAILSVSGFVVTSGKVGEATIAVRYYETVKHFKFTVSESLPEPSVVTGYTLKQIEDEAKDAKNTKLYEAHGTVKGWKTKDAWNDYGEFELEDSTGTLYIYGSYVNTTAEPASFSWDGSAGKYANGGKVTYTARNAKTADMTKDLKIGDEVVITVCHAETYDNYYGIFKSVTAGAVIECTSVELNKDTLTLTAGESETLTATILPENCNQQPAWESSAEAVATVDQSGKVVAVAAGDAVITVTVGSQTDTCNVHVNADTSKDISLTVDTLGANTNAYSDSSEAVAIKEVNWNYKELGNYGSGLQWRTKNSKSTSIWNSSATAEAIASVTFNWNKDKEVFDEAKFTDCITVEFANNADFTSAQTLKVTFATTGDPVTLTPNAGMTFVRMTHANKGASLYLNSIVLSF